MNLKEHYDQLYLKTLREASSNNFQVDKLLDAAADDRYGITLLIRPDEKVKNKIQDFLHDLKTIEPEQYYYPNSDIHITVMSIISCYSGFTLDQIQLSDYINLIRKSVEDRLPFKIHFNGITASTSGIMIQGFFDDSTLNDIRDQLRIHFKDSNLEQSLDKRYAIQTAHSTVVRFRKEVTQKEAFLGILEQYRDSDFGTFQVDTLELVGNDWYQKMEKVKKLSAFSKYGVK